MTPPSPRRRWVRRHPVLTVIWLVLAAIWLIAIIAVYDDNPGVSLLAYLIVMAPVTLVIVGQGAVSDRIRRRRVMTSGVPAPLPERPGLLVRSLGPDVAAVQRKSDEEARRQQDLARRLGLREAALARREADLGLREALLQSQPQPVSRPESKPSSLDTTATQPGRLPDQTAPAKFCVNCGAWFARDDQTCWLCGAQRVGAEA